MPACLTSLSIVVNPGDIPYNPNCDRARFNGSLVFNELIRTVGGDPDPRYFNELLPGNLSDGFCSDPSQGPCATLDMFGGYTAFCVMISLSVFWNPEWRLFNSESKPLASGPLGTYTFIDRDFSNQGSGMVLVSDASITISNTSMPNGKVGVPYYLQLTYLNRNASYNNDPPVFSMPDPWPVGGMSLDPATGIVSGTPDTDGVFIITFVVLVNDSNPPASQDTHAYTWTIDP